MPSVFLALKYIARSAFVKTEGTVQNPLSLPPIVIVNNLYSLCLAAVYP